MHIFPYQLLSSHQVVYYLTQLQALVYLTFWINHYIQINNDIEYKERVAESFILILILVSHIEANISPIRLTGWINIHIMHICTYSVLFKRYFQTFYKVKSFAWIKHKTKHYNLGRL